MIHPAAPAVTPRDADPFARPLPADEISVLLAEQAAAELPPRTTLSVA
jgi:hypothetical protein